MIIRWTDAAVRDFTHICDYIEERRSAAVARRVALSIHHGIDLLAEFPDTGERGESRTRASLCSAGCRILPFIVFTETRWRSYVFFTALKTGQSRLPFGRTLVAVMMLLFFALTHGNHAAMRYLAFRMFELDRRVVDAEVVVEAVFHVAQNALTD